MKMLMLHRLLRYIAAYHILSSLAVLLVLELNGASGGGTDVKTKLLLQNIRAHLAQKADEMVKKKECESGLILCKALKSKEAEGEEEKSEEIPPPPKVVRGQHKPTIRISSKDVTQTFMPKAHKKLFRKLEKTGEDGRSKKIFDSLEESDEKEEGDNLKEATPKNLHSPDLEKPLKASQKPKNEPIKESPGKKQPAKGAKTDLGDAKKNNEMAVKEGRKNVTKKDKTKEKRLESGRRKEEPAKPEEDGILFPGTFIFVLNSDEVQSTLCQKHTQIYLKQLKKYKIWALMMYDASAKLSSGVLQGNVNQFGDFDECLAINAVFKNPKEKSKNPSGIRGKYCLATIDVSAGSDSENLQVALERAESFQFIKSSVQDPGHFIPRFSTINWGLCVPSACLAEDVLKFVKSRLEGFANATGLHFDIDVDEDNCVVKEDLEVEFRSETAMVLLFYLIVFSISFYATFLDLRSTTKLSEPSSDNDAVRSSLRKKAKEVIMAFSLKKNAGKLLTDGSRGSIECINGIKSIFTVMLYFAHKTIPLGMTPFSNRVLLTKISNQPITILLRASLIYTDSFLLISGILTSYNLAKEITEKKKISWVRKAIARFIRLTPALLAVVLFYAYVWDRLGSGPVWNLVVGKNSLLCRKYLWRNLLYIQNFFDFEEMCAPQTHQLALDMQLSLLAPFFVHLMHTYDKTGVGILQALFILSSIMRYMATSTNDLSVVIYHGMSVSQLYKTANLLYGQTFHRASPYILGTIIGYYLKKCEKRIDMPKAFAALGWILSFTFGFYSVVSPSPLALRTYRYDVQEAAQYAALSPVAWSLALSWLIVACHLGYGGFLNQFFCRKIFLVFSRISYSVYLTQFLVFFYKVGSIRIPALFTLPGSVDFTEFSIVIGISLVVTLFFDLPMMEVKKIILDKETLKQLPSEGDVQSEHEDQSKDSEIEGNTGGDAISREDSQDTTDELPENEENEFEYEDEVVDEAEVEDEEEEELEEESEEEKEDEEVAEIFQIRPLRRSTKMHFSDEPEEKAVFKEKSYTEKDE